VWANGGGWRDGTPDAYPDWLQIEFNGAKTISEIDVFAVRDDYANPAEPTESETFSLYGITSFDVQYWDGSAWVTIPNGSITNNNKVWTKIVFAPITTTKIRVLVNNAQASYSRIVEVEAYTSSASATPTPTPTATPTPTPTPRTNFALTTNGGSASASSESTGGYPANLANDGVRNWATSGGWRDGTINIFPDWLQIDFNGSKIIDEINVYTVTDDYSNPVDPTENTVFTLYGVRSFDIQYWNGSAWLTIPYGSVTNNDKALRKFVFPAVTTNKIRVVVNDGLAGYSRIVELEAWSY
jgi:hypothetical protein